MERLSTMQRKSLLGIPIIPSTPEQTLEVDHEGPVQERREAEQAGEELERKAARFASGVKVLRRQQMNPEGKWVDLKEVFDWRFRQHRTGPYREETVSPTSSHAVVRLFLLRHISQGWKLASLDISDAYLTVE